MGARAGRCDAGAMKNRHEDQVRKARGHLVARAAELRERIGKVQADLSRTREPLPRDSADAAIVLENDEVLRAIETTAHAELGHIDQALLRMDAGAFGICETCGAHIEQRRLDVVPYATRCEACERKA
jgi:RNA polymerase-binding transcription factor DksA